MNALVHCIYASHAKRPLGASELRALLTTARTNNGRVGISGVLLYADGSFFQVLEGEPDAVQQAFARIRHDQRHEQVTQIIYESIPQRSFADWTMGFADAAFAPPDEARGLNDFFSERSILTRLHDGRAKKILQAFGAGRWRSAREMAMRKRLSPTQ